MRAGWSGEMANGSWRKADVDVDESDLARLSIEHDFDLALLTNVQAYQLLEAEANMLLLAQLITRFGVAFQTPEYQAEFQTYVTARANAVAAIQQAQA